MLLCQTCLRADKEQSAGHWTKLSLVEFDFRLGAFVRHDAKHQRYAEVFGPPLAPLDKLGSVIAGSVSGQHMAKGVFEPPIRIVVPKMAPTKAHGAFYLAGFPNDANKPGTMAKTPFKQLLDKVVHHRTDCVLVGQVPAKRHQLVNVPHRAEADTLLRPRACTIKCAHVDFFFQNFGLLLARGILLE